MAASRQSVEQTLAEAIAWRPVLEPMLRAFEPVLSAQAELTLELADSLRSAGLSLPEARNERLAQGVSLLAEADLAGIAGPLRAAAEKLLPLLENQAALAADLPALKAFFFAPPMETDSRESLAEAIVSGNQEAVSLIAKEQNINPQVLEFVSTFVVSAVLRAMVAQALHGKKQAAWDEGDVWRQGYCPVCGALPSVGWLDKPVIDEDNAYLAGGGGKKHLHCGLCGADWKFRRSVCPGCGQEGNGVIEILRDSENPHGERLDWCTKCRAYCPTVDLREREFVPNLDAAAFGMMHLDLVAADKKMLPLKPAFWNKF